MHGPNILRARLSLLLLTVILFFRGLTPQMVFAQRTDIRVDTQDLIDIRMIVVPEFENDTGTGTFDSRARIIPDLLTEGFNQYGGGLIRIIGRDISKILDEIAFEEKMGGIIDPDTIEGLRGLGANYYTTGRIARVGEQVIVIVKIMYIPELTEETCRCI